MKLGLKGINYSPVSACATGTDAIGQAFDLIIKGDIDYAVAGGSEAAICQIAVAGFDSCRALSSNQDPESACRPFDKERDGFILGEGAGALVAACVGTWAVRDMGCSSRLRVLVKTVRRKDSKL